MTVTENVRVAVVARESVTPTVNEYVPAVVGVPAMLPDAICMPGGSVPPARRYV